MSALGSLVVKLGLEYAEFTGGLDKSEQAALASAKRVQDTFDGMKSKLAATAGAIAGGLAAGFTVAAFKSLIGGAIETGAALDDLAMQTGSTVEALSGLAEVGKFNDMGPEKIGAAMNVLTRNLAGATEESKGAGAAIKALGLDMDKFRALKPEDQMQAVATALDGVQDGAGKSAVMMALYGKEGAQMLPFMKDLASVGELQAKVTAEQAAAAAQLDDNWVKLTTTGSETAKEVAMGMVPAFDEAVRAAMDVMAGTGGMREMLRGLVADGSIKQWTTEAIKGLSYVADAGHIAWRVLQSIGKGLGGLAAALVQALQGDFRGAWNVLKDSGQDMIDTFDGPTIGARFRESLDKVAVSSEAAGGAAKKTALDFRNLGEGAKGAKGEVDKLAQSGTDLAQSLLAQDSGLSGDFHKKWDSLSAAYRANKIGLDVLIAAQAQLLEQQPAMKKAFDDTVKASQAAADARRKEADGIRQWFDQQEQAVAQSLAAVQDRITSLRDEGEALALAREQNISLAEAVERLAIARLEEKQARFIDGSEGWQAIQKEIDKRKELLGLVSSKAQREDEARGWADMWQSVDRTAHDTFVNVLEGGQDAFKRLGNTLKASVLDVLYQMTVRKWIINIGTSVFGAGFGAAANAATGGGAGGALSTAGGIGNMASLASGIGSFTTAGMLPTGIATALTGSTSSLAMGLSGAWGAGGGMLSTLNAGMSMLGSGSIMSGLGTLAGALGPIALGIAALAAIFGKKATPHAGAASTYSEAGGLVSGADIYRASGLADTRTYNAGVEQVTGNVAKAIGDTLNATAKTFGKTAGYEITTAFADDTSKDGAWGSLIIKQMGDAVIDWRDTQTSKWAPKEFADGEAGSKEYLAAVAKSARDALVQAIGSVDWATDMLKGLGESVSLESLAQTVQQINAAKAAFVGFGQYMPVFAAQSDAAVSAMVKAAGGVDALAGNMAAFVDGFYTDAEKLAINTQNVTDALAKLGFEMPATRDEFKALVQSQIALGDAGAQTTAGLLAVSGAVSAVLPPFEDAAAGVGAAIDTISDAMRRLQSDTANLQIDLLRAQGNTTGADAAKRAIDTSGMSAAEIAIYDYNQAIRAQITSLNDAAAAAQEQATIRAGFERELLELSGDTAALRLLDIAGMDAQNVALYDRVQALRAEQVQREQAQAQAQREVDAFVSLYGDVASAMDEINPPAKTLVDAFRSTRDELTNLTNGLAQALGNLPEPTTLEQLRASMEALRGISQVSDDLNEQIFGIKVARGDQAAVELLRSREASLFADLQTSADPAGAANMLAKTVLQRIAIEGKLEEQAINSRYKNEFDAAQTVADLESKNRRAHMEALRDQISGAGRLSEIAKSMQGFIAELKFGDLSALNPVDQLAAARGEYQRVLSAAKGGDVTAAGQLQSVSAAFLREQQGYSGGATSGYASTFAQVMADLDAFGGMPVSDIELMRDQLESLDALEQASATLQTAVIDTSQRQIDAIASVNVALLSRRDDTNARADEQKAILTKQVDALNALVEDQKAQIKQAAATHQELMVRLEEMSANLDRLTSNSNQQAAQPA